MIKDGAMIYCEDCSSYECGCPERKEIEAIRQQLASRDAEVAEIRRGNSAAVSAYTTCSDERDQLREQVAMLRTKLAYADLIFTVEYSHIVPSIREALAATADLDKYVLCEKEPVYVSVEDFERVMSLGFCKILVDNKVRGMSELPLYRAKEQGK